jgi:hypothetical protein
VKLLLPIVYAWDKSLFLSVFYHSTTAETIQYSCHKRKSIKFMSYYKNLNMLTYFNIFYYGSSYQKFEEYWKANDRDYDS